MDALHAVRKTFEMAVTGARADVLVCVKDNASNLRSRVERMINRQSRSALRAETAELSHGRFETRSVEMIPVLPEQTGWPHTHVACRVTRQRQKIRRGEIVETSHEKAIYVGSFAANTYSPAQVLQLIRGHWGIENKLHHRKDRSMDEDRCRASASKTGRVMCCLRSIAAMVLGRAKESLSVVQRRFSRKTHLILALLSCTSLAQWERTCKPYKLA